jgi:hypothetical protein
MAKIRNTIHAGMNIHMLIFNKYAVAAINHHKQNAQLSPMKTLAGLILKNMKATRVEIQIHKTVVAKYLCDINSATANVIKTKIFNHPANQSSPSVMFTAFTINIVAINVSMGNPRHR